LECLREARAVKDRELSKVFHRLAAWWIVLAHQADAEGGNSLTRFSADKFQ
jgi:hypothetical protein